METISDSLGSYNDINVRVRESNGIMFLEEKLFLIELLSDYMCYYSSLKYVSTLQSLLNYEDTGNEVCQDVKKVDQAVTMDTPQHESTTSVHTKDCFLVYCSNPIKIIIMLQNLNTILVKKYSLLHFETSQLNETLHELLASFISGAGNL